MDKLQLKPSSIATETIVKVTSDRVIPKAQMTSFETARLCYVDLSNYVKFIEERLGGFTQYEIAYSDEGYRLFPKIGKGKN